LVGVSRRCELTATIKNLDPTLFHSTRRQAPARHDQVRVMCTW